MPVYACSMFCIYLVNFLDINNLVSRLSIFVFHIDNLRARLGVVIYAFYPFFSSENH